MEILLSQTKTAFSKHVFPLFSVEMYTTNFVQKQTQSFPFPVQNRKRGWSPAKDTAYILWILLDSV